MVSKYIPSHKGIGEVSQVAADEIDNAIGQAAQKILEKAQQLAREAGHDTYAASLRIDAGARPKGRGYRRVIADDDAAQAIEYGDSDTERLRILGRASGVTIFPDAQP